MARISTYDQDSTLSKLDKLLGTDSGSTGTKLFSIDSIVSLINEINAIDSFDGLLFEFKDYQADATDPQGILNLTGTNSIATDMSAVTQLILSDKALDERDYGNLLGSFNDTTIKISERTNGDVFGIFKVLTVGDHTNDEYKIFSLEHIKGNGQLTPGRNYFVSTYQASLDSNLSDRNVTEFGDVTDAGSGAIITDAERAIVNTALVHNDVVDNVTSTATDVPLSANQGKVLKDLIDTINTLLTSDNVDLDTLQEVVDFIEANRDSLDNLSISNIAGLQAELDSKQDAETGKGLSTNDFTTALLNKLNGIAAGAEVNVNSDWNATTGDAQILNKPTDITQLGSHNVTELNDVNSAGSGYIITDAERTKLTGIDVNATTRVVTDGTDSVTIPPANAEENVQANWNETNNASDAFIQNKPDLTLKADKSTTIEVQGTANEVEVSPTGAQDLSANRSFTVGLPDDVTVTGDITVGETIELSNAQTTAPTFDNGLYYSTEDGHDTLHFKYHGHDLSIDYLTEVLPTGILNGGELTKANNTQFTIAAGDGIINDLNKSAGSDPHPEIQKISWTQQTITVSNLDSNNTSQLNSWIYVDNTGTVRQQASAFTDAQKRSNIVIGSAIHSEGVLKFVKTFPITAYSSSSQLTEFANIFGPLKKSGHRISANGANLSIDRSAGVAFALGRNYATDPENPSTVSDSAQAAATIHRYYRDGSNGFVLDDGTAGAGYTGIDPTKYDDGTGTLATVSGGHFSVQRLFYFPGTPGIIVSYYGHDEYNSMDIAEKEYAFEDFEEFENTAQQAIYLGAVIVQGNASALNNSSHAKFLIAGNFRGLASVAFGGVSSSAALGDLSDVDVTSPSNGQLIQYNSSTTNWENTSIDTDDVSEGSNNLYYTDTRVSNNTDVAANTAKVSFPGLGTTSSTALAGDTQFVDGTGTAGTLPKMSDSDTITDSSISESGQVVDIDTTGAIKVPDGGTSARPTAAAGMFRYNTDTGKFEGYTTEWGDIGGASENIINVTVAQVSGSNKFHIDGSAQTALILIPGQKYIIDQSDSSNAGHPLKFSTTEDGTHGSGTEYTTGITVTGTAGSTGAKIEVTLEQDSPVLYYYCANHSEMGGKVQNLRASGAAVVERRTYSPDGSTLTFAMGQSVTNENNVFVYIDGVYQNKSTFTVSGSDLVFETGNEPPSGTELEIISYASLQATDGSSMFTDVFTGNGSTTAFTLSSQPASIDHTLVYIQGVYQEKEHYSLSGSTITFTTAPQDTYSVEIISITSALTVSDVGQIQNNTFTGNGTTTDFTLSLAPTNETHTLVYINGVYQEKSTYSVTGTTLSFTTAPSNGDSIEVESRKNLQPTSITFSDVESDLFSGTGSQTSFTLVNGSPGAKKDTMVYINGVYQNKSTYSLTSGAIVFTTAPSNGDEVEVVSISQVVSATTGVTSVNGASGDIETRKYDVEVISADANAEAYHVYIFTATLTLTLPASPEVGQWIKISNRSGVATCVLGANTNKIMGATTDMTLDTASASFELIYSGTAQGWVIIGQ